MRLLGTRLCTFSKGLLQAMKAEQSPGNDDKVSIYNLTVFHIKLVFYWMHGCMGRSENKAKIFYTLEKKALFCSLKMHSLKKNCCGAMRGEII